MKPRLRDPRPFKEAVAEWDLGAGTRRDLATHEAGHAVVEMVYGWTVERVTVMGEGGRASAVGPTGKDSAFPRAVIFVAGMVAELISGRDPCRVLPYVVVAPGADVPEALRCIAQTGATVPEAMKTFTAACLMAREILTANWPAVEAIAAALMEHGELDAKRVRELIDAV